MKSLPIGIFDSGAGGLNVLNACHRLLPHESFLYLSDRRYAPYGDRTHEFIVERAVFCARRLTDIGAKAIVVACNTATNAAIGKLREEFAQPVIGVEPAIKPAMETANLKRIVLLCTPATASSEKFHALCTRFDASRVVVSPQQNLAALIENNLANLEAIRPAVYEMLSPYSDADAVVLGCTHYPFIASFIRDYFSSLRKQIQIFDGSRGTAMRLKLALYQKNLLSNCKLSGHVRILMNEKIT